MVIPTGISIGENTFREIESANKIMIQLIKAETGICLLCTGPTKRLAIWGPSNPKKAIFPATEVASPAKAMA